jgi:hypothetical protein
MNYLRGYFIKKRGSFGSFLKIQGHGVTFSDSFITGIVPRHHVTKDKESV